MKENSDTTFCIYFFLCIFAYGASIVFMFSAIILMSGYDHYNNGIIQKGEELISFGKILALCSLGYITFSCVVIYNKVDKYVWSYVPSLLFSVSVICYILANSGIECGRCSRLYLSDIKGELDNTSLLITIQICKIIMTSSPLYVFVLILINKVKEHGNNYNVCELIGECFCETVYCILIVFYPLFMIAICCLTGGEGMDNCKLDNTGSYNGTVYNGNGVPMDSRLEMV